MAITRDGVRTYRAAVIPVILTLIILFFALYYNRTEASLASSREIISNLNNEISRLQANVTSSQNEISSLHTQLQLSGEQLINAAAIYSLAVSAVWVNPETIRVPTGTYSPFNFSASYSGYITVNISSSTVSRTYITVSWNARGIDYNQTAYFGSHGVASFPVLLSAQNNLVPCPNAFCAIPTNVQVRIGNGDSTQEATMTVSISYTY